MGKFNISKGIVENIKSLHSQSRFSVLTGGTISEDFGASIGVRQGCPLSPCLFNLFLEQIIAETLHNFEGTITVGGRKVNNLRFTDDIDLLASSIAELDELTRRLDKASADFGMEISADKSKILSMGIEGVQPVIGVKGGKLEAVQTFKYLGATITKDGRSTADTKIRIAIGRFMNYFQL